MNDQNKAEYELVFEGPADDRPETLRQIKGVLLTDLDLDAATAAQVLANTPAILKRGASEEELIAQLYAMKDAGGKVHIVAPKELGDEPSVSEPALDELNFLEETEELWEDDGEQLSNDNVISIDEQEEVEELDLGFDFNSDENAGQDETSSAESATTSEPAAEELETSEGEEELSPLDFSSAFESDDEETPSTSEQDNSHAEPSAEEPQAETLDFGLGFDDTEEEESSEREESEPVVQEEEVVVEQPAAPEPSKPDNDQPMDAGLSFDSLEESDEPETEAVVTEPSVAEEIEVTNDNEIPAFEDTSSKVLEAPAASDSGLSFDEPGTSEPEATEETPVEAAPVIDSGLQFDMGASEGDAEEPAIAEPRETPAPPAEPISNPLAAQSESPVADTEVAETEIAESSTPKAAIPLEPEPSTPAEATPKAEPSQVEEALPPLGSIKKSKSVEPVQETPEAEPTEVEESVPQEAQPTQVEENEEVNEQELEEEVPVIASGGVKKMPYDMIGAIAVGLVIIVVANMGFLAQKPEPKQLAPLKRPSPVERLQSAKVNKGAKDKKQKKKKLADPETLHGLKEWNDRVVKWNYTHQEMEPQQFECKILMSKPPELTPEQIVAGETRDIWVHKVEATELEFEAGDDGVYTSEGPARIYLDYDGKRERIVGDAYVTAVPDKEGEKVELTLNVLYGLSEAPPGLDYFAEPTRSGDYELFVRIQTWQDTPMPEPEQAKKKQEDPEVSSEE